MKTYIYKVAELNFTLSVPRAVSNIDALLPSMSGFRVESADSDPIFEAQCVEQIDLDWEAPSQVLECTINDMGKVQIERRGEHYLVSISHLKSPYTHYLCFASDLRCLQLKVEWQDMLAGHSLNSLLRIAFAQAVVRHGGVSIHGSTVIRDGVAYLFLGKSGTGKSTHSRLWQQAFEGCELLNDDNPTIRVMGDTINIYGTPWSGKTPCYKNKVCRLQGVARLQQAPENKFITKSGVEAFIMLLPGCAVLRFDNELYDRACDTLFKIVARVNVGMLMCLPDVAATQLCYEELRK